MASQDLTPLHYTDAQMAQLLQTPPDQLSSLAGPADLTKLFPALYAQQANQKDQPEGYARGGRASRFRLPNYVPHMKSGGKVYNVSTDPLAKDVAPLDKASLVQTIYNSPSIMKNFEVAAQPKPSDEDRKPDADVLDEYRDHPEYLEQRQHLQHKAQGGLTTPTDAQKHAGNYKKMHGKLHGMHIAIENPAGSFRTGKDKDGQAWSVRMPNHYGYIKRTEGADGDQVDVHVGPHSHDKTVHVVDQVHPDTGKFNEHKVMMGFKSPEDALHAYHLAFSDGKGHMRMGGMVSMHVDDFKKWLAGGHAKKSILKPAPKLAAGGMVPVMTRFKSPIKTEIHVPSLPHYRDQNMDGGTLSKLRDNLRMGK